MVQSFRCKKANLRDGVYYGGGPCTGHCPIQSGPLFYGRRTPSRGLREIRLSVTWPPGRRHTPFANWRAPRHGLSGHPQTPLPACLATLPGIPRHLFPGYPYTPPRVPVHLSGHAEALPPGVPGHPRGSTDRQTGVDSAGLGLWGREKAGGSAQGAGWDTSPEGLPMEGGGIYTWRRWVPVEVGVGMYISRWMPHFGQDNLWGKLVTWGAGQLAKGGTFLDCLWTSTCMIQLLCAFQRLGNRPCGHRRLGKSLFWGYIRG